MTVTDKQYRLATYVENGGFGCPICLDPSPMVGALKFKEGDNHRVFQNNFCFECGTEWEDAYMLTSARIVEER